jgi:hypothetical protein
MGEEWPRFEDDHSSPSSAEVKNDRNYSYTCTPPTNPQNVDTGLKKIKLPF